MPLICQGFGGGLSDSAAFTQGRDSNSTANRAQQKQMRGLSLRNIVGSQRTVALINSVATVEFKVWFCQCCNIGWKTRSWGVSSQTFR